MFRNRKSLIAAVVVAVLAAVLVAIGFAGSSNAGSLVGSLGIRDNSVRSVDVRDNTLTTADIKDGQVKLTDIDPVLARTLIDLVNNKAKDGVAGPKGDKGEAGTNGLVEAYYATAKYNAGDTNQGAIATVACSKQTDVAISGGVQMIGVGGHNSAVGSSFPGRMNWDTNTPREGRLDGWIVQFDAAVAPEKVTLWALCVPGASVNVVNTYAQQ
jgi:hypothetical protein